MMDMFFLSVHLQYLPPISNLPLAHRNMDDLMPQLLIFFLKVFF